MGRESKAREEREQLLREGMLHLANGIGRIGNALAVTIIATYTMSDEPDEEGKVDVQTFNYNAFRSTPVAVPHLEQAERIVRDARTNILLGQPFEGAPPEDGSSGMEVPDGGIEEALRETDDHGD